MSDLKMQQCKECGKSYSAACRQCHVPQSHTPQCHPPRRSSGTSKR